MKVGHSRQCLTPQTDKFYLLGYKTPKRNTPAAGVHDDIFSNALLIETEGERTFLWSADLLELPDTIAEDLKNRIVDRFDIDRNRILLSVMHDHSSVRDFHDNWEFGEFSQEYYDFFVDSVLRSYEEALGNMQQATARWGKEIISGYYSNRNHQGELADNEVIVIKFFNEDDKPFAALVNWAVHSTAMGASNMYLTGDLAGNTCRKLGEIWGYYPMMLNGDAADCSNRYDRKGNDFEELERESQGLAEAISKISVDTELNMSAPKYKVTHHEIHTDMEVYRRILSDKLEELYAIAEKEKNGTSAGMPVSHLIEKCQGQIAMDSYSDALDTQVLDLGELRLYIFPGELSSELGKTLKESSPNQLVLIAGYTNGFHYYFFNKEEYGLSFETIGNPVPAGVPEEIVAQMVEDGESLQS